MADYSIISDISNTLIKLLRGSLCPEPMQSPESIILASPIDKNADFQLGLYLYDIKELGEYRQTNLIRNHTNTSQYPPKPLNLYYMLFLNDKAQVSAGAEDEQRVLGKAIQTIMDNLLIDVNSAHPYTDFEEENASITFLTLSFEEKSKIWSALSTPYQLGLYFSVSPIMLSSKRTREFTRVISTDISVEQKSKG